MLFVILMGGPGAGKGTQARLLKRAVGLPQIASGDLFREHFANDTDLGELARQYIDRGDLVPDEVTVAMIKERIARPDAASGAIFDGFPRTMAQAEDLGVLLDNMGEKIDVVAYIHVDPTILLKRLAGRWTCRARGHVFHDVFGPPKTPGICDLDGSELYQRDDDTVETQRRRIEVYLNQTAPLLDYYQDKGLMVEVDGERTIGEVQVDLINIVRSVA